MNAGLDVGSPTTLRSGVPNAAQIASDGTTLYFYVVQGGIVDTAADSGEGFIPVQADLNTGNFALTSSTLAWETNTPCATSGSGVCGGVSMESLQSGSTQAVAPGNYAAGGISADSAREPYVAGHGWRRAVTGFVDRDRRGRH